jgi:photosystem II stability/assembly factor-like uncharacterized protein
MASRVLGLVVAAVFAGGLGWQPRALPFRPLGIASVGQSLWVCGTDGGIAVSLDGGGNWKTVRRELNGPVLLNIAFADARFGYAAGSNGLLLTTGDGGDTWTPMTTAGDSILQVSFADAGHGLIRTRNGLFFTVDGGAHWPAVPLEGLGERFRYSFALAALDRSHMLVVLKDGPAEFYRQTLLVTTDGGATWTHSDGPDALLASFVTQGGAYWAVGHVDSKKGSVPAAFSSQDGRAWNRAGVNLSACQRQGCSFCTNQGCLAANGTVARVFKPRVDLRQFPPNEDLTPVWAATDTAICMAGDSLQCAPLEPLKHEPSDALLPKPVLLHQPPLGSMAAGHAPYCLVGSIDPSTLASNGRGPYELHLTIHVAPNGTVESVDVAGAPAPEIADRVRQRVRQWIYEPTIVDGAARAAIATASVRAEVQSR